MSALLIANTDCTTTERSTLDRLGDVSWSQKADLQLYRRNVPLLHTSRYVIACDSVYQAFPESHAVTYQDMWRSGTFLLYSCKAASESKKRRQDCLMSSAQSFYGPCLQSVAHSLTCCFSGNVPLLHTSRYVIPRDSVLPGLPPC